MKTTTNATTTNATTTNATTTNAGKKTVRRKKKDIPAVIPSVVPAAVPVPAAPAPLTKTEQIIVAAATRNIEIIALANKYAAAQAAASATLDEFCEMVDIPAPAGETGYTADEIRDISNKIYRFIPCWPMANREKPVTVSAILSKNGKWSLQREFYVKEDSALYTRVPVSVVRMVNACIKRLYRVKPTTVDVTIYQIPEIKFNRLLSLIVSLPADTQKLFADALNTVERKTVKKKDIVVSIDDVI